MANRELPQLTPDQDLGADGMRRFELFWETLQAAPGIMHAVIQAHPTYEQFSTRATEVRRANLTTYAALAMTSLADLLLHRDDELIYPDGEMTRKCMEVGLKNALSAAEEGRLTPPARGLARFSGVIKAYADACPPMKPIDQKDILKQLGVQVSETKPAVQLEVPPQRIPKSSHSATLAA